MRRFHPLLPAGRAWDVLVLPGALGCPTLDVLTRDLGRPGPVLVDFGDARTGSFVPPGTASRWVGTGSVPLLELAMHEAGASRRPNTTGQALGVPTGQVRTAGGADRTGW